MPSALPAMLHLELAPLAPLSAWPTVAVELAALTTALRGGDGVTEAQIQRLQAWSRRWSRIRPSLRAWYATHAATDNRIGAALYHVLNAKRPRIGVAYAASYAYRDTTGHSPGIDLIPFVP
jgi:hypothetical protein